MIESSHASEQDKQLKSLVLVALGSFLFFFYIFLSSVNNIVSLGGSSTVAPEPEVYGTSTETPTESIVPVGNVAALRLNNAIEGEGVIELVLSEPTMLAGAELNMLVDGNLDVRDLVCDSQFECYYDVGEGTLDLVFFRYPNDVLDTLSGTVELGTLIYAGDTYAELVLNDLNSDESIVLQVGSTENLLPSSVLYLPIGRPNFE